MLLRALGAQPRRRKPAFVTHDNEASLCGPHDWKQPIYSEIPSWRRRLEDLPTSKVDRIHS